MLACAQRKRSGIRLRPYAGSSPVASSIHSACREAWPFLPALEAGDRWFESTHADQIPRKKIRLVGRGGQWECSLEAKAAVSKTAIVGSSPASPATAQVI